MSFRERRWGRRGPEFRPLRLSRACISSLVISPGVAVLLSVELGLCCVIQCLNFCSSQIRPLQRLPSTFNLEVATCDVY
jgi:hypothetical protein